MAHNVMVQSKRQEQHEQIDGLLADVAKRLHAVVDSGWSWEAIERMLPDRGDGWCVTITVPSTPGSVRLQQER
jgi:hypothetical protein